MRRIIKWLEATKEHLEDDFDAVVPVIGDEGMGKSTLIMELGWLWHGVDGTPQDQTVENTMGQIAWDLNQFKEYIGSKPKYSCIHVHDAARVLSRKKAMHGKQIEVEEDLLDMRFGNYLVLLGYQEFDLLPTMLATRRSKMLLHIPERGVVHGHNEENIRHRYEEGSWPEPTLTDTYPSLEGKDLWSAFNAEDARRKQERIKPEEENEDEELPVPELADKVVDEGIQDVVSIHGGNGTMYIDADLIEIKYGISGNKAKKVSKLLKKDVAMGELALDGQPAE